MVRTPGARDPLRLLAIGVVGVVLLAVVVVSTGALALRGDDSPGRPRGGADAGDGATEAAAPQADRVPAEALLPDLASLPADELGIRVRGDGQRVLRFAAALANTGSGPLQVDPVPVVDCPGRRQPGARAAPIAADRRCCLSAQRLVARTDTRRRLPLCRRTAPLRDAPASHFRRGARRGRSR